MAPQNTSVETQGENHLRSQPLSRGLICRSQVGSECGHAPESVSAESLSEGVSKSSSSCSVSTAVHYVMSPTHGRETSSIDGAPQRTESKLNLQGGVLEATTDKPLRWETKGPGPFVAQAGSGEEHFTPRLQDSRGPCQAQRAIQAMKRRAPLPASFN